VTEAESSFKKGLALAPRDPTLLNNYGQFLCAQERYDEIGNRHRTHYCGAYWFNGFHEDGVRSALRVTKAFGVEL